MTYFSPIERLDAVDRRNSAERMKVKLRSEISKGSQRPQEATLLDISATGMLLQTRTTLSVGDEVQVELPNVGMQSATVVWESGEFYGCRFDELLSKAFLSAAVLRSEVSDPVYNERAAVPAPSMRTSSIGTFITQRRKSMGYTQDQLANKIGVSKASVCKWENDKVLPRKKRLTALATALDVDAGSLSGPTQEDLLFEALPTNVDEGSLNRTIEECKSVISRTSGIDPHKITVTISI